MVKVRFLLIFFLTIVSIPSVGMERFVKINWISPDSSVIDLIQYPQLVERVYRENNDDLIWFDLNQALRFEFQLELIKRARISPLFSSQLSYLQFYRKANRWFEYDLLATDTMLLYMSYAEQAPLHGESWFFEKQFASYLPQPSENAVLSLYVAVNINQLDDIINTYTPTIGGYKELLKSYAHLKEYEEANIALYKQVGIKKVGDSLPEKANLLARLKLLGIKVDKRSLKNDIYDRHLAKSVREFQKAHGLKDDGKIDPVTVKWLNVPAKERLSMIALNAERLRIWPEQKDSLIIVNVPNFAMKYWKSGKEVFESKVVVGRKSRKTPVMETNLDSLVLNPIWNVPWKIMVADIIPKVKKDATYLVENGIEIVQEWKDEETINPEEIQWETVNPYKFPYKMRQRPGNINALGLYKFNTPNPRAIFLHDTPSKDLFNRDIRAFSSGCVRIEKAGKFADLLLKTQVGEVISKQNTDTETRSIPLKKSIPVHIIYQTVWFESGQVQYRDDVYNYDSFSYNKG
ncbi:L,D-transpeptidase family protein [Vibrio marisflavi]|uniref:L,D-transpeptidase YcbB n=1 Tax=Vibrio marisflavi CECT 7928 TaxID=634439 RepID=A0ABM9A4L4_9VIBR|nr:L,D-transpeptidase family protein [Vibrio marisflavi]CAH0539594.1 putative L,D-transpeptidase YcbB [Vibrio marisflavi CECT 7928]